MCAEVISFRRSADLHLIVDHKRFRAFCAKVAEESDPQKLELLKQRLRLLLMEDLIPRTNEPNLVSKALRS
jgi:hypothetical protein